MLFQLLTVSGNNTSNDGRREESADDVHSRGYFWRPKKADGGTATPPTTLGLDDESRYRAELSGVSPVSRTRDPVATRSLDVRDSSNNYNSGSGDRGAWGM